MLVVKYGKSKKNAPFHPALKIDKHSGFCRNQWTAQHFREGCFVGHECVANCTTQEAISKYFADLKRMGYQIVTS